MQLKKIWLLYLCLASAHLMAQKNISIAWDSFPRSFDPRYAVDADSQYLENLMHCSLVDFDADGNTITSLAKNWSWEGQNKIKIELKEGIRFSNGKVVQGHDVKATLDFFSRKDLKIPTPRANAFNLVDSVAATDSTVTILLKEPDSTFITNNLGIGILPKESIANEIFDQNDRIPGCGPFQLDSVSLTEITLKKNLRFNLSEQPKINQIEIKIVKDEGTRFSKLLKGEVDIVQNSLSYDKLENFEKRYPKLDLISRPGLRTSYVGFNLNDPILKKKKVRQAISHAINKDEIITYLLKGLATKATTLIPPTSSYYRSDLKAPEYDPKKAIQLLKEAGFERKGSEPLFKLSYKTTQNNLRVSIANAIAQNLRKIGIEVKIESLEWGRFKEDVEKGRVQLWGLTWIGFKDPDIYRYAFATESFPPNGGNRGKFSHPEVDLLLDKARKVTDLSERKKLYSKVQELIASEAPYVFLWHDDVYAVLSKKILDYQLFADGRYGSLKKVNLLQ